MRQPIWSVHDEFPLRKLWGTCALVLALALLLNRHPPTWTAALLVAGGAAAAGASVTSIDLGRVGRLTETLAAAPAAVGRVISPRWRLWRPGPRSRAVAAAEKSAADAPGQAPRVVIVGSGFGGLFAARALATAPVEVTVVARTSQHLFQPLLYQVATGTLSEGAIAQPTREVLRAQHNARVVLGDVTNIDLATRTVTSTVVGRTTTHGYDELIVAAGAGQSYFGNDGFAEFAPGVKTLDDALELRGRIFGAFELAELATDPAEIDRLMTLVVVGGGPTGVELAGQIAELAHRTLRRDFRRIDPTTARVVLIEGGPALMPAFGKRLGEHAHRQLADLGVDVRLGSVVTDVDVDGVTVRDDNGHVRRMDAAVKIWAAGVQASPLGAQLGRQSGAEVDRAGRVAVRPDLTLPGHPEVHVVGDMTSLDRLPGLAPVAIQGGRYAAEAIRRRISGHRPQPPFRYRDRGSLAIISRYHAVAEIGKLRFEGFLAWVLWLAVHLANLVGFASRMTTLLHWSVNLLGRGRSQRVATEQQVFGRLAIERLDPGFVAAHVGGRSTRGSRPRGNAEQIRPVEGALQR